jgi:DNA-binding beta-propeller fold protein YncE
MRKEYCPALWYRVTVWLMGTMCALTMSGIGEAKDLLVTGAAPNQLYVIDGERDEVIKEVPLSGRGTPISIVVHPQDSSKVYVVTNQAQGVCMADIDAGKEVSCLDLSTSENGVREIVRATSVEVNPKSGELYVYEMPVKVLPGKYEIQNTRIRVLNSSTLKTVKTFAAPRQGLVLACSPDGTKLYSFHVGDIHVFDTMTGQVVKKIPLVYHNVTGVGAVDGLPFYPNYAENGHVVAFPYGAEDPFRGIFQLGFAYLDLNTGALEMFEVAPFGPDHYYLGALASPKTGRGYMCWNVLSMVDLKERKILKSVMMDTTRFYPNLSSDGKKLYLPKGSGSTIGVYDATELKPLKIIELKHNMAATALRVIKRAD